MNQISKVEKLLIEQGKAIYRKFMEQNSNLGVHKLGKFAKEEALLITQPDEMVVFRQLKGK